MKTYLRAFADSEGPDQPAHSRVQGIHRLLTESLYTTECMNGEHRPGCYFAHAQDDLNMCTLRMFEGTFRLTRHTKCNQKRQFQFVTETIWNSTNALTI